MLSWWALSPKELTMKKQGSIPEIEESLEGSVKSRRATCYILLERYVLPNAYTIMSKYGGARLD